MSQIKMPSDGLAEDALYEAHDAARENDVAWRRAARALCALRWRRCLARGERSLHALLLA